MINNDLAQLPINEFLNKNGLVCVWCTNSQNHIDTLKCIIFPTWKIKYVACWYWIKVFVLNFNILIICKIYNNKIKYYIFFVTFR